MGLIFNEYVKIMLKDKLIVNLNCYISGTIHKIGEKTLQKKSYSIVIFFVYVKHFSFITTVIDRTHNK